MQLKDLNTIAETARYLGFKSEKTIRNWIKKGKLKSIQPFGKFGTHKISREAIEKIMDDGKVNQ